MATSSSRLCPAAPIPSRWSSRCASCARSSASRCTPRISTTGCVGPRARPIVRSSRRWRAISECRSRSKRRRYRRETSRRRRAARGTRFSRVPRRVWGRRRSRPRTPSTTKPRPCSCASSAGRVGAVSAASGRVAVRSSGRFCSATASRCATFSWRAASRGGAIGATSITRSLAPVSASATSRRWRAS